MNKRKNSRRIENLQTSFIRDYSSRIFFVPLFLQNWDAPGFYSEPFFIATEESIEIALEDEEEIIRGRIDVLVLQQQLWLLVIESKRASFSLLEAIPQGLAYMLANPNPEKPVFGLVSNGSHFIFLKLTQQDKPKYALSDEFTLLRRRNELYQVLAVLKTLGTIISQ